MIVMISIIILFLLDLTLLTRRITARQVHIPFKKEAGSVHGTTAPSVRGHAEVTVTMCVY